MDVVANNIMAIAKLVDFCKEYMDSPSWITSPVGPVMQNIDQVVHVLQHSLKNFTSLLQVVTI